MANIAILNFGNIEYKEGNYQTALNYYLEALNAHKEMDIVTEYPIAFAAIANLLATWWFNSAQNDLEYLRRATRLCGAVHNLIEGKEGNLTPPESGFYQQTLAISWANLDEASFSAAFVYGTNMAVIEALEYALKTKL